MRRAVLASSLLTTVLLAGQASAVGTRTFDLDTLDEFSGGDLKGVAVSSDGAVRAGWTTGTVALTDATASFSAIALADGSSLVGTSPGGKVFKIAGDRATLFADTGSLAVTSMVEGANGVVYAATIPDGKIFKLTQGKAELLTALPETSHVWALAFDKAKSALFAATGPEGRVMRVELSGASSVYFRSNEPHIVSLAVADNGDVFAGSSGKGLLYRITGPGRATVLYDFPGEEVKGVAVAKGGVVFAIANEYGEPPEPPKRSSGSGRAAAGPASTAATARPKPGKGTLYRFDPSGRPERMMKNDEFHYTALSVDEAGRPYVGTGAEGRVYTVDDAHVVTLVLDTDERQVGAIGFSKAGPFVATSDPPTYHRVVAQGGAESVWTSKVFDAGLRAKFGQISWRASGPLELSTRTGNTTAPDATWSGWSPPVAENAVVPSPIGRFVQVRARWARDPKAVLSEVLLPFMTENTRPIVLAVDATPKSGGVRDSKEGLVASGGEPPKHDSVLKLTWKVDNPDNDALRYRIGFRREGQGAWRDVLRESEVLTKSEYEWDTLALPEGKYRLRVEASDEQANAPADVQRHVLESSPVLVDNTPPTFSALGIAGRRLKARVVDGLGPITRVEVAVDGKLDWRPVGAADGVFDSADEAVDADISTLVPTGSHIVAIRAFDAAGNAVIREIETP
ncbi:MAG: hypothetical protein ABIP39_01995 [Polyangiaceae bacterium]